MGFYLMPKGKGPRRVRSRVAGKPPSKLPQWSSTQSPANYGPKSEAPSPTPPKFRRTLLGEFMFRFPLLLALLWLLPIYLGFGLMNFICEIVAGRKDFEKTRNGGILALVSFIGTWLIFHWARQWHPYGAFYEWVKAFVKWL